MRDLFVADIGQAHATMGELDPLLTTLPVTHIERAVEDDEDFQPSFTGQIYGRSQPGTAELS